MPGRLGLLITLYLIATNVYNSVNAPSQRGFSYIEIWMIGIQFPMLVGIIEYGILLAVEKYHKVPKNVATSADVKEIDWNITAKKADKWTCVGSLLFLMFFNIIYWIVGFDKLLPIF